MLVPYVGNIMLIGPGELEATIILETLLRSRVRERNSTTYLILGHSSVSLRCLFGIRE